MKSDRVSRSDTGGEQGEFTILTKFLIVDDFESMRRITADYLKKMGAKKIRMAENGAEALQMLKEEPVDLVITDWNMPVMTGLALLKAIRADEALRHLPVLMITAEAEREKIMEAIESGVSSLLVKPYTSDNLYGRVRQSLAWKPSPGGARLGAGAASTAGSQGAAESKPVSEPVKPTILVVDDTPDNLQLLSGLFKEEYRVKIANSGDKALAICQSDTPPDLVLLDIMMPDMDGFEVARRMREHPSSEAIPVIFVTAMDTSDAQSKGLELGAVDFITKPINPDMLKPKVRNFLRYVELHKQLQADYDSMLAAEKLKEDVEHMTRHDMKGPLAGVIGLVQALSEDDSMGNKQLEQLRMVEETALQVLNMINLSSELYKIETGKFVLHAQPVKVGDILRRIVEILRAAFRAKQLSIAVDTDFASVGDEVPQILGDAMLCYSLFHNLVKNACEAAPENSRIEVAMHDSSPMNITISNKGVVPKEIRERFFDKFATFGKEGGTGLGTYSAKLLSEAQNGTISLETSDADNSTTITVSLPRAEPKG